MIAACRNGQGPLEGRPLLAGYGPQAARIREKSPRLRIIPSGSTRELSAGKCKQSRGAKAPKAKNGRLKSLPPDGLRISTAAPDHTLSGSKRTPTRWIPGARAARTL